jgi:hypothetical protein
MSLGTPKAGFASIGEFQLSALPFVTSSQAPNVLGGVMRIDFPKVTRFINITNHDTAGNEIRIGFTRNGVVSSGNYYKLDGAQTISFELRVKHLFLAGDSSSTPFSLLAGLTTIDAKDMPLLSGTLLDGSAGWEGVG